MLSSQGPVPHPQARRDPAIASLSPGAERRHDEKMPLPDLLPHIPGDPEGWVPVAIAMATPCTVNHLGGCCLPAHPTLAPAPLPTEVFAGCREHRCRRLPFGKNPRESDFTLVTCCQPQRTDGQGTKESEWTFVPYVGGGS